MVIFFLKGVEFFSLFSLLRNKRIIPSKIIFNHYFPELILSKTLQPELNLGPLWFIWFLTIWIQKLHNFLKNWWLMVVMVKFFPTGPKYVLNSTVNCIFLHNYNYTFFHIKYQESFWIYFFSLSSFGSLFIIWWQWLR